MNCPNCNADLYESCSFCSKCGEIISQKRLAEKEEQKRQYILAQHAMAGKLPKEGIENEYVLLYYFLGKRMIYLSIVGFVIAFGIPLFWQFPFGTNLGTNFRYTFLIVAIVFVILSGGIILFVQKRMKKVGTLSIPVIGMFLPRKIERKGAKILKEAAEKRKSHPIPQLSERNPDYSLESFGRFMGLKYTVGILAMGLYYFLASYIVGFPLFG